MLKDLRIGKKLGGGFGLGTALLVILGVVVTVGLLNAARGFDHYRQTAQDAVALGQVQAFILKARVGLRE
jgi:methyl-accepting chemotaxis protein